MIPIFVETKIQNIFLVNFAQSDNAQECIALGTKLAPLYANKGDGFLLATWDVLLEYPQCTARNAARNNIEYWQLGL